MTLHKFNGTKALCGEDIHGNTMLIRKRIRDVTCAQCKMKWAAMAPWNGSNPSLFFGENVDEPDLRELGGTHLEG